MKTIIRPNATTVFTNATAVGAATEWEAIDDVVTQPTAPNTDDYITGSPGVFVYSAGMITSGLRGVCDTAQVWIYARAPSGDPGAAVTIETWLQAGATTIDFDDIAEVGVDWAWYATNELTSMNQPMCNINSITCQVFGTDANPVQVAAIYAVLTGLRAKKIHHGNPFGGRHQ